MEDKNRYSNLYFRTFKTYKQLEEGGFTFLDSCDGVKYFSYKFPVCYWKKESGQCVPTLFGYLIVNSDTMEVNIDVKTIKSTFYPDFYNNFYGNSTKLLNEIHKNICKMLKKFDIIRKEIDNVPKNVKENDKVRGKTNDGTRNKKNRGSNQGSPEPGEQVLSRQESHRDRPKRRKPFRKVLPENG